MAWIYWGTAQADTESLVLLMLERRTSPRLRTFKGGSIIFGLVSGINCVIRNMSQTGACLEVENPLRIPDDFALLIKPEIIRRNCHVAWRSARRIGVRFV